MYIEFVGVSGSRAGLRVLLHFKISLWNIHPLMKFAYSPGVIRNSVHVRVQYSRAISEPSTSPAAGRCKHRALFWRCMGPRTRYELINHFVRGKRQPGRRKRPGFCSFKSFHMFARSERDGKKLAEAKESARTDLVMDRRWVRGWRNSAGTYIIEEKQWNVRTERERENVYIYNT